MVGMQNNRKIAVFVSFSGRGGVERMMANLCEGLVALGCHIDLLAVKAESIHVNSVPEEVNVIKLSVRHTWNGLLPLTRYLRQERPAAILAAKDRANQIAILARRLAGVSTRVVVRMGTTISAALNGRSWPQKSLWYLPLRLLYPMADAVVAVSEGVARDVMQITGLGPSRISVIPNPVISPKMFVLAKESVDHPWLSDPATPVIMGVGRFTRQKDFPTLLRAFASVRSKRPCRLIILGEGRDRVKLEQLAQTLSVQDDVDFPGFVVNPYGFMSRAALFVLSSIWEGSPNVLTEALALGIPVVATDCPSGPREILKGGLYGDLVPTGDVETLAQAMLQTLARPKDRAFLQQAVCQYWLEASSKRYLEVLTGCRTAVSL
jgi:glycosyltransferase involved in cell wall biosynthesis